MEWNGKTRKPTPMGLLQGYGYFFKTPMLVAASARTRNTGIAKVKARFDPFLLDVIELLRQQELWVWDHKNLRLVLHFLAQ